MTETTSSLLNMFMSRIVLAAVHRTTGSSSKRTVRARHFLILSSLLFPVFAFQAKIKSLTTKSGPFGPPAKVGVVTSTHSSVQPIPLFHTNSWLPDVTFIPKNSKRNWQIYVELTDLCGTVGFLWNWRIFGAEKWLPFCWSKCWTDVLSWRVCGSEGYPIKRKQKRVPIIFKLSKVPKLMEKKKGTQKRIGRRRVK